MSITGAAYRAANAITDKFGGILAATQLYAAFVDRETGLPEILGALEAAQTYIRNQQPKWSKDEDLPPIMHEISAALQKAKGQ